MYTSAVLSESSLLPNTILGVSVSSEGSGEIVHRYSLVRAFPAPLHTIWAKVTSEGADEIRYKCSLVRK